MTGTVETTGAGLVWRDHEGRQAASITLASNDDGGTLIVAGTIPPESDLTRECLQHLTDLFHRVRFLALVGPAGRSAPPRAPHLPS